MINENELKLLVMNYSTIRNVIDREVSKIVDKICSQLSDQQREGSYNEVLFPADRYHDVLMLGLTEPYDA